MKWGKKCKQRAKKRAAKVNMTQKRASQKIA
jgi:hypothetical protein